MQTQCERLLSHLQQHGKIDQLKAWSELGIYRLGARMFDLRKQGHKIAKKTIDVKNKFGEACRVAEYRLHAGGQTQ